MPTLNRNLFTLDPLLIQTTQAAITLVFSQQKDATYVIKGLTGSEIVDLQSYAGPDTEQANIDNDTNWVDTKFDGKFLGFSVSQNTIRVEGVGLYRFKTVAALTNNITIVKYMPTF